MAGIGGTGRGGQGRDHQGGDGHDEQRGDHPDGLDAERLDAVLQSAEAEGEPEDEQAVGQDRADQRALDHHDQSGAQAEDPDEQLGQVAQGRLQDAGQPGPEALAELLGALAHESGQAGQGDRRGDERGGRIAVAEFQREADSAADQGHGDEDQRAPAEDRGKRPAGLVGDRSCLGDHPLDDTGGGTIAAMAAHNRLAGETSPYLLQHAHNPVDWYPWGPAALERARAEDKPIFLSIGYAACHWCHVMERESFEDPVTAAELANAISSRSRWIARSGPTSTRSTWRRSRR